MSAAPLPPNETERLEALRQARLLDTPPEPFFEDIVDQVREHLGSPIVLVSLVDGSRQWFKACYGLSVSETDRESAFCAHAILDKKPLLVADALADSRFESNPLVLGAPHIRAYAGAPIELRAGMRVGTICAIDVRARDWTSAEIAFLARSARLTARYIEARTALDQLAEARVNAETAAADALRSRDALAESERQFRAIAESARDIIVRYEPDTTLTYVSPACLSLLGYAPEELVGRRLQEVVHPEDLANAASQLAAVAAAGAQGPPFTVRMRALQKDGAWRWMEGRPRAIADAQSGAPLMFYDVIRDVTLQRELELELHAARERAELSEAHYRVLADHSSDIIIRAGPNGMVRYASPAVRMFGITPEEAVGRSTRDLVAPQDRAFAEQISRENFSGAEIDRSKRREYRVPSADGRLVWLEGNPSIVRDDEGRPIEIITSFRDVTARRELEDELVAAREHAEDAARAKSDFLANMSHELRTPLNSVVGFSKMLARSKDLTERDRRFASLIEASSRATLSIVNDVLDFAALEKGDIALREATFSLRELVVGVRDMIAPLADAKELMLGVHFDQSVSEHFIGDADRLRQVLINLTSNAVKFTDVGAVTLTVSSDGNAPGEQTVAIAVQDSGIGIPADRRDVIFERFVRLTDGARIRLGGVGAHSTVLIFAQSTRTRQNLMKD